MRTLPLIFVLILPSVVLGQRISIDAGAVAGIPLSKGVQPESGPFFPGGAPTTETIDRPAFVAGPAVEVNLPYQISIEADFLYRPIRFQTHAASSILIQTVTTTAHSTELPILGQFHFGSGSFRPNAGVGFVVYDKLWGSVDSQGILPPTNQQTNVRTPYRPDESSSGPPLVLSGGFSWAHPWFTVNPQLRYTRWVGDNVRNQNQWDILLGLTFPVFHHKHL